MPDQIPLPFVELSELPLIAADMVLCATCQEEVSPDDTLTHEDARHCTSCVEECEYCSSTHLVSEGALEDATDRHGNATRLCDECRFRCDDCSEYFSDRITPYRNSGGCRICEGCAESYSSCDSCERVVLCDNTYSDDSGDILCHSCYVSRREEQEDRERAEEESEYVHSYGYRPRPNFHSLPGENTRTYFGIEIEVDGGGERNDTAIEAAGLDDSSLYYLKTDGSLSDGFEVVSHPATWQFWQAADVSTWAKALVRHGYRSYKTDTCGMHVHVSRKAMSEYHLYKLLSFAKRNKEFLLQVSRRKSSRFEQWCNVNPDENTKATVRKAKAMASFDHGDRYCAINTQPTNTVEFRIFRGTLNADTIKRNLAFVYSLVLFAGECGAREMSARSYLAWIASRGRYLIGKPQATALLNWLSK